MQCVILAGGLGTRMWPVAPHGPQDAAAGRRPPVRRAGSWTGWPTPASTSVVYCVGLPRRAGARACRRRSAWGLAVGLRRRGPELRGTAGALRLAHDEGVLDDRFLVLYGDSWLQVDPARCTPRPGDSGLPALMTVYENNGHFDTSNVEYAEGRVVRYEKGLDPTPPAMRWIDYGLSVLERDLVADRVPGRHASPTSRRCATTLAAGGRSWPGFWSPTASTRSARPTGSRS